MHSNTKLLGLLVSATTVFAASAASAQDWSSASETFYFQYDKTSNQTSIDTTRLDEVIRSCNVNSINIVGHADTSGNAQYNQGLSLRRAEKIKSRLVANGFSANAITTRGAGENELAVLTGDGVKEQLNRRAEIVFSFAEPCGLYYTAPAEPVYSEPVYSEPVYSEPVYSEPAYVEPAQVYTPAPEQVVTYAPAPTTAPTPIAAPAPTPITAPAPVYTPAPVATTGGGIPTGLFGAAALVGVGAAAFIIADGSDDDEPVSP